MARLQQCGPLTVYAFKPFLVDPLKRQLWRDGTLVPIRAKTFDVLVVLLEHRERIVSKDELLSRVWPNTAVQENNLVRQMSSLRQALGQTPDQHDYIVTIPGRGYRFVARVEEVPDADAGTDGGTRHTSPEVVEREVPLVDTTGSSPVTPDDLVVPKEPAATVASSRWSLSWVMLAIGAVGASMLAVVLRPSASHDAPRRALQRVTYDEAAIPREGAWSPDGQHIVYTSNRSGNSDLWVQRVGTPDPRQLTTSDYSESQPHWSPDGRSIVFRSERDGGGLFVISAGGGTERVVSSFGYEPRWSPDGRFILFKRSTILPDLPTIYLVGLDGRPPRPLRPDVLARFATVRAAWHPDGRRVSIWTTDDRGDAQFMLVPVDDGRPVTMRMSVEVRRNLIGISPGRFEWTRSGRYIYFDAPSDDTRNIWRITVDPAAETLLAGPDRVTMGPGEETRVAASPDGTRLLFTSSSTRTRLWAFPLDASRDHLSGQPQPITEGSTGEDDFDAQTDGSKVVYRAVRAGRSELWERSVAEGRERLLVSSADWKLAKPRWSPDGARLAFLRCGRPCDAPLLAVLNADGSGERALTTRGDVEMLASDWSQDGQSILGACRFRSSDRYSICLVPAAGGSDAARVQIIAGDPQRNLFNQRFSPNQRWITFLAHDLAYNSTSTVYVIPAAGGSWQPITDGSSFDDKPRFGPDGRLVYYVSNRYGVRNVWARRFDDRAGTPIGEPFPITFFQSPQFQISPRTVQMDIAVTRTHLLIPMSESRGDIWMLDHIDR